MNRLEFFKTKAAWKQLGLMACSFLALVIICFFFLGICTRHGQAIVVPSLQGRVLEELAFMEEDHGFKFVVRDSVFDPNIAPGTILYQSPKENSKVKQHRTFYLVVAASRPTMVAMPNLRDLSLRQCSSLLETYGLKIGTITYQPSLAKNAVLEQLFQGSVLQAGDEILKGSVIDLIVGGDGDIEPTVEDDFHENIQEEKNEEL